MADIKGTNISAPIVPFTTDDIFATHEAMYGKGGYRTVENVEDLDKIPAARLEEGMLVYVINDDSGIHTYQYIGSTYTNGQWVGGKWTRDKIGKGIPIYNQQLIDDLDIDITRETYISIPEDDDINGEVTNETYRTTGNGNYVDILFKALRELQSEVAKIKNSFLYGIESYTGKTTAMTVVEEDLKNAVEEEPLWAIEEDGLSELTELDMSNSKSLSVLDDESDVTVITDTDTFASYLKIVGSARYTAKEAITNATDSKLFLYLTTSGLKVEMNLTGYPTDGSNYEENTPIDINLEDINLPSETESGLYNTLIVLSRKQKMADGVYYGKNFIWISIGNPETNQTITEGYLLGNRLVTVGKEVQSIDEVILDNRYYFNTIDFTDTVISKCKFYSKYQDFTQDVIPSKPSDEDYKFKVAHLTIRSVEDQAMLLSVKDQILNNELIWDESSAKLWIKTNNKLAMIGGSSEDEKEDESGMTTEEMIEALKQMGIVQEENGNLSIDNLNVDDITFIHSATGRRYKFEINSEGNLMNYELPADSLKFSNKVSSSGVTLQDDVRGFIGQLRTKEGNKKRTSDAGLFSDRLKIGSFYAPLSNDIIHGCSHSFVELENTADVDFALDGCYLHYTRPLDNGQQTIYSLPLTGIIPAGGTYLIRGAKHAEINDPNVYIKVNTCDQDWYDENGNLISFEINENLSYSAENSVRGYGFVLTYGNDKFGANGNGPLEYTTTLVKSTSSMAAEDRVVGSGGDILEIGSNTSTYPYILSPYFIDGIYYKKMVTNPSKQGYWAVGAINITSNTMYRNTFELDPAKQAFQGFTTKDSSRVRWASANDIQIVDLSKEYIEFPHTEEVYAISNYTPKASWEHKNISTDKTKLDKDKPNMVSCSFGIDIYKTRCFNWVSIGYFDEYVWVKESTSSDWAGRFKSYLPIQEIKIASCATTTTPDPDDENTNITVTNLSFDVMTTGWNVGSSLSKYTQLMNNAHSKITDVSGIEYKNNKYNVTLDGDYSSILPVNAIAYLKESGDETVTTTFPKKKMFNADITNNIYARMTGRFPGDNSFYTAHKVILDITGTDVTSPTEYTYVVGRTDKNGNPDPNHCSEEMKFTLYPSTYKTRLYQVTDQQGFHWIEYQVWNAAADMVLQKINSDKAKDHIIPILVNTGDMTQNGTRVNEWFDYYQSGKALFNHLEQMNCVGNNDLCGPDPSILGTGDDNGKSNSYYFHLFFCYEVGNLFTPLVPSMINEGKLKYIPSFYYFDSLTDRFIVVNSEITETTCSTWYELVNTTTNKTINIYTGFEIDGTNPTFHSLSEFTPIYTMLYDVLNDAVERTLRPMVMCHEMPFTVITAESLMTSYSNEYRSLSHANALVGSHLNQISKNEIGTGDDNPPGIYWFSRLLEHFNVKLVIGGHKHTYACTYPLRENYNWKDGDNNLKDSLTEKMIMHRTLESDKNVKFFVQVGNNNYKNLTKYPLTKRRDPGSSSGTIFYPCVAVPDLEGGIVYFMCQATGYKLTSNKELPSSNQKFSRIIPQTINKYNEETGTFKDTANSNQKYPMFAIIDVDGGTYGIKLARVLNIFNNNFTFAQNKYSTAPMTLQYLTENENGTDNYGTWGNNENLLIPKF